MAADLNFNIFNSIILAGIIQGFIFGAIVGVSKKYRSAGTRWLTTLIVVFSFNNLQYYLQDTGIITSAQLFATIYLPYQYLSGPLLLFYGLALLFPEQPLSRKTLLVLMPFAIGVVFILVYKAVVLTGNETSSFVVFYHYLHAFIELSAVLFSQGIVLFLLRQLKRYKKNRQNIHSRVDLQWFRSILITFFLLSFVWLYIAILSFVYDVKNVYYGLWIAMSIMIYWLGHVGIYRFGVETERKKLRDYSIASRATASTPKARNGYAEVLTNLIVNEKRYLDPNLTLDNIAEELNLSKSHLSRIFNSELKTSFPDFVNALRVETAKSYLSNSEFADYTLVAIGLEAGFNSKTTFNNAFKKATGMTPSDFKNAAK